MWECHSIRSRADLLICRCCCRAVGCEGHNDPNNQSRLHSVMVAVLGLYIATFVFLQNLGRWVSAMCAAVLGERFV